MRGRAYALGLAWALLLGPRLASAQGGAGPDIAIEAAPPAPAPTHEPTTAPEVAAEQGAAAREPPAEPAPAQPPAGWSPPDAAGSGTPGQTAPQRREPGPPGSPLDLIPIPPLSGLWGYGAEVVAAIGSARLLSFMTCVPLVGPIVYIFVAPPYIVDAIAYVARSYTETGARDPGPALVTTYVVEGLRSAFTLLAQASAVGAITGLALAISGDARGDRGLTQAGGVVLASSGVAGIVMLLLLPASVAAELLAPHIEVMAYRYFEAGEPVDAAPAETNDAAPERAAQGGEDGE